MTPEALLEADLRTLGLEPGSGPSEVRRAYLELVKKYHPDRHHSKPYEARALAEKRFREIDEAYRRIAGNWGKMDPPARHSAGAGRKTRPHGAKPVAVGRPKINVRPRFQAKFLLFALLLASAVFILTQFPSFFPGTAVDTEPPAAPAAHLPSATVEGEGGWQAPQASGVPQSSADLTSPSSPASPPARLKVRPEAPHAFFTLGSTGSEVLSVQGAPSRVQGRTWIYGLSDIEFKNGYVSGFNNFDGSLRVRMPPGVAGERSKPPGHITIGSTEREVLLVQGTPTQVEGDKWFYGFAELTFKNGRVAGYDNYFGSLKIRLLPSLIGPRPAGDFFTIGSTPEQVLAAQGTPTAIHGNRWSYNFAFVFFRDGRVRSVIDSEGALRFHEPGKTDGNPGP